MSKTDNSTLGRAGIILIAVLALACSTPHALAQAETWAAKAPMPTARDALVVGVIDGMLYAVGGEIPSSGPNVALGSVEAYDPRSNSWTSKSVMPTPRYGAGGGGGGRGPVRRWRSRLLQFSYECGRVLQREVWHMDSRSSAAHCSRRVSPSGA